MGAIPVTTSLGRSDSGGQGLERTGLYEMSETSLTGLRGVFLTVIPAVSGKIILVKYAAFWPESAGPGFSTPADANLRLHYAGQRATSGIIDRDLGFLGVSSGQQIHIERATNESLDIGSVGVAVNITLVGGTGEITAGSGAGGGLRIRVVYDLLDAPA